MVLMTSNQKYEIINNSVTSVFANLLGETAIRSFLKICRKTRFVAHQEDINFLHCGIHRASEEVRCGAVVRVRAVTATGASAGQTVLCIALTGNCNVISATCWTRSAMTRDCEQLLVWRQKS
jgi:hypothetical protein